MASPLPTPALPDELVEEILIRIPPDNPERLLRAALACKGWCRLVSGTAFRRRFRRRHGMPPMLGVVLNYNNTVRFVPACSFRPQHADRHGCQAIDSRHGRVLLYGSKFKHGNFFSVWDPVMDELRQLPALPQFRDPYYRFKATVLCAARGSCDHLNCSNGPFLVVFMSSYCGKMFSYVYSSEADSWSEPTSASYRGWFSEWMRAAHVRNSLYFVFETTIRILEYDLGTREMTLINPPPMSNHHIVLMTAVGGGLGCATVVRSKLCLWSGEAGPNGDMRWTPSRAIAFETLIPVGRTMITLDVVGFEDGSGVVYVGTDCGSFATDLKSGRFKEVEGVSGVCNVVPFMSFYTPGLRVAATGEGPMAKERELCRAHLSTLGLVSRMNMLLEIDDGTARVYCRLANINDKKEPKKPRVAKVWTTPDTGWAKVNTDGAIEAKTGKGAAGAIWRNERGETLAAEGRKYKHLAHALTAEALAARNGLLLAVAMGCNRVILELDNQTLANSLKATEKDRLSIGDLWQEIQELGRSLYLFAFLLYTRKKNSAAHCCAKMPAVSKNSASHCR
ncbi:hypothetical protein EJB05_13383, partial [Eragrostis curvula]